MKATLPVSGPHPSRRLLAQAPRDEGTNRLSRSKTKGIDPEKRAAVFPCDKRETRLRGDHAQSGS
jgi:hypothetical protein